MGLSTKGARAGKLEQDRFNICAGVILAIKAAPLCLVQFDFKLL